VPIKNGMHNDIQHTVGLKKIKIVWFPKNSNFFTLIWFLMAFFSNFSCINIQFNVHMLLSLSKCQLLILIKLEKILFLKTKILDTSSSQILKQPISNLHKTETNLALDMIWHVLYLPLIQWKSRINNHFMFHKGWISSA